MLLLSWTAFSCPHLDERKTEKISYHRTGRHRRRVIACINQEIEYATNHHYPHAYTGWAGSLCR